MVHATHNTLCLLMLSSKMSTLVADDDGNIIGAAVKWNPHGLGECIVQFYDGSADSCMFNELNFVYGEEAARRHLNLLEP